MQGPGGVRRIDGVARDITERHLQEAKIRRLNRMHAMLSGISSTILRVRDRTALLQDACHIAVREGGFRMAWIAQIDPQSGTAAVAAASGVEEGYIEQRLAHAGDLRTDPGPAGIAVREHRAAVCNDIANDPAMSAWRDEALQRNYRSAAVFPLLIGERLFGEMCLYAEEVDFFDEEEIKLLQALSGDVSFALELMEKDERLQFLAYFDPLTGLPNRRLFEDRVAQAIAAARHGGETLAVVFADLERFRSINDTFGRAAGDKLLREVALRLAATASDSESIARVAGDCFAGLFTDFDREEPVARGLQRKLTQVLVEPFDIEGQPLHVSFRCGLAFYPADGTDADHLFRNAEAALKRAKSMNEPVVVYTPEINARVAERLSIETKLRRALDEDRFVLHYQPKIALATGEISGFEALLRWQDPELGLVLPGKFIGILEETGLILDVGRWVMREAARVAARWAAEGFPRLRIAVNVSPIQLRQKDFVASVRAAAVDHTDTPGIDLEITESVIMRDIDGNVGKLRAVREMDIGVAIDDFGTGYSSLAYVAKLPVTALKIDRTFVSGLETDRDSRAIVASMLHLAHSLDLDVVAEGVERVGQARVLKVLECNNFQGFLYSPPVPANEIPQLRLRFPIDDPS